jgi:hypothetical protein
VRKAAARPRTARSGPYRETSHGLIWDRPTRNGVEPTALTNVTARIAADIIEDDGAEEHRLVEIEARLDEVVKTFVMPISHFAGMNWATEQLGTSAIVYPGHTLREQARTAIQVLRTDRVTRRIYTHMGWRNLDSEFAYLHAGGAIGPKGPIPGITVRLPEALRRFALPPPPSAGRLRAAIRASLNILGVGPDRIIVPLYAAMPRAALGTADFSLYISGPTGAGKSVLGALLQQHYGPGMDAAHLPASWSSTGNALEGLAFYAKDALLLVDDFAPVGSQGDVQRLHKEADRLLRAQGNNAGRHRMRSDASLRPTKFPRGLIVSTGEDAPRGQSLRARFLLLELGPRDLAWKAITACQVDAAKGRYAEAFAGFVKWLAGRYEQHREQLQTEVAGRRDAHTLVAAHRRTSVLAANLEVGLRCWLSYGREAGAIDKHEHLLLLQRLDAALEAVVAAQGYHQEASEPATRFLELLRAAMASGAAHVATPDGGAPWEGARWGWRATTIGIGGSEHEKWRPQGVRVGWIDRDDLYLEPEAAFAAVQRFARDGGESITVGSKTLHKRLHERKLLRSTEKAERGKLTVRRTVEKQRRAVLHLDAESVAPLGQ